MPTYLVWETDGSHSSECPNCGAVGYHEQEAESAMFAAERWVEKRAYATIEFCERRVGVRLPSGADLMFDVEVEMVAHFRGALVKGDK
jgi:hypothetical protein